MRLLEQHQQRDAEDRRDCGVHRSAVEQLFVADAGQTGRTPAGHPHRLQHRAERHRLTGTFNKLWQDRNPDQLNDFDQRFPDAPNFGHTVARRPQRSFTLRSTAEQHAGQRSQGRHLARRADLLRPGRQRRRVQTFDGPGRPRRRPRGRTRDELAHAQHAVGPLRLPVHARRDDHLAEGEAQLPVRRRRVPRPRVGRLAAGRAGHLRSGSTRPTIPRPACSARRISPGASTGSSRQRALALRDAHRPCRVGQRPGDARSRDQPVLVPRQAPPPREDGQLLDVRPGLVAREPRPDAERRRALGRADAVLAAQRHDVDRHARHRCAASRGSATAAPTAGAISSSPARRRPRSGVRAVHDARTRATRPTGTTSRRTSASRGGRASRAAGCGRSSAIPSGRPFAAAIRSPTSARDSPRSPACSDRTREAHSRSRATPTPASCRPASRGRCCCSETSRLYPAPFPASPTYPIAVRANRADSISAFHPDIEIAFARTWTVGFQRSLTSNMAVEARYVGTRGVDQWSNLDYNELQHHRERLLQRVQAGDGELPGEQRRGRQPRRLVRLLRTRHRHGAAADLSRLHRGRTDAANTAAPIPARPGRTPA